MNKASILLLQLIVASFIVDVDVGVGVGSRDPKEVFCLLFNNSLLRLAKANIDDFHFISSFRKVSKKVNYANLVEKKFFDINRSCCQK